MTRFVQESLADAHRWETTCRGAHGYAEDEADAAWEVAKFRAEGQTLLLADEVAHITGRSGSRGRAGAIFRGLVRRGLLVPEGWAKSRREGRHRGVCRIYRIVAPEARVEVVEALP